MRPDRSNPDTGPSGPCLGAPELRREARHSLVLFDDLVGAVENRWRNREAECLSGLKIDDQLKLGRLLDGQIGWPGALEDPSDVDAALAKDSRLARSIADQAAGGDVCAVGIDGRNDMACCQRCEELAAGVEERIARDNEPVGMQLDEGGEGAADLAFSTGLHDTELHPLRVRRFHHVSYYALRSRIIRIDEQANHPGLGNQLG